MKFPWDDKLEVGLSFIEVELKFNFEFIEKLGFLFFRKSKQKLGFM